MALYKRKPKKYKSLDGRDLVRSDSRPKNYITNFTMCGDATDGIGDGKIIKWDFSNSDDDISAPSGYKRKRIELGFSEKVYIKEGTVYFFDTPKGAYLDMKLVCKTGGYYADPNGVIPGSALGLDADKTYTQATSDTPVVHYVNHHFIQGSVPMGDELNTEGASEEGLPPQQYNYVVWVEITTPDTDSTSNGYAELELYRPRTVLLPGESV